MFFDHLEIYGNREALIDENDKSITYNELCDYAELIQKNVNSRKLCLVLCKNTIGLIIGYSAFLKNRIVPIMVDASMDLELIHGIVSVYNPEYIYCPCETELFEEYEKVLEVEDYLLCKNKSEIKDKALNDELALLLTTSGTTGSPKFVRLSYANIEANTKSICEYLKIDENEVAITTLPINYTYGLSVVQTHLCMGAKIVITDKPVINKDFWGLVKKHKVTSIAGVPYTYQMLKKIKMMSLDLPDLKTMTQAGGKLPYNLHKEFGEYALNNGKQFVIMYGQTEATARMAYLPADDCIKKCGSIGIAIPGGRFELIDDYGNVITDSETEGELVYHGENVSLGYATSVNELKLSDENKGILKTGDLAKWDEDGYLYITGRKKRFVKLFGSRINLDEIEQIVNNQFTNVDCACVGVDDYISLYVTDMNIIDECKKYLLSKLNIVATALNVIYLKEIPKNSSGKTDYKNLPSGR